jgi:hypothetical protein
MTITPSILFISLTGIILFLIGIVILLERFVARRKEVTLQNPAYEYTAELKSLKKLDMDTQQLLNRIDLLARKALSQATPGDHVDYSQLAETYKDKTHIVQFCEAMTESLYAGERITPMQTKNLLHTLEDMLKGEGKIILIEPKEEKLAAKQGFFLDTIIEKVALKVNKQLEESKKAEAENKVQQAKAIDEAEAAKREPQMLDYKKEKMQIPEKAKLKVQKDKTEYHYIESIDVLDRIEKKLSAKKTLAKN